MTQMSSLAQSSSSSIAAPPPLQLPSITMPPASQLQFATHGHIDLPHTPVASPSPSSTPRYASDVSDDLEPGISPKATGKQVTMRPRYSCGNLLTDTWSLFISLAFVTLVCTIFIFLFSTTLTDIGAHLLSWNHRDEFLTLLTWPYSLAAVAIGSAILGSIFAFALFLLGMNTPNAIVNAPPSVILPPCALGSVFALPIGIATFPRSVVPDVPFTWKDALSASAAGAVGFCAFVMICTIALLAGAILLSTLPLRRLSGRAKDVSSDSSECVV
ncbi:hypothetical protein LXA43DRAFT_982984 [Ganoderma leucocontextum]|nr:hypothetical protein LXA43DRAFT_982984 [Ganoderma leucocontextum]